MAATAKTEFIRKKLLPTEKYKLRTEEQKLYRGSTEQSNYLRNQKSRSNISI